VSKKDNVIKIPFNIVEDYIGSDGLDFEYDGEEYIGQEISEEWQDDDGQYFVFIYKRKSDGKYFSILTMYRRYGYEDYGFEKIDNDGEMNEVKKVEKTIYEWVRI